MAASVSAIELFNLLRQKVGEPEAKALTDFVTGEVERKFDSRKESLASRDDIHQLESRFSALEVRIEQNTNKLLLWLVSVIFASSGLIVALMKLL